MRVRRPAAGSREPVERAGQVGRVETIDDCGGHGGSGQHLAGDREQQRPVARVAEDLGQRLIGDRGGRQHGVLGQAGPQAAEDAFGHLGVREVGGEEASSFGIKVVQLADQQRGPARRAAPPPAPPRWRRGRRTPPRRARGRRRRPGCPRPGRGAGRPRTRRRTQPGRRPARTAAAAASCGARTATRTGTSSWSGRSSGATAGTATVKLPAGSSTRSPAARTAATTAGSGSLTSTSWPSRARQAATAAPVAPQPSTR